MTGKNRYPTVGWHPPAELADWVRAEAKRRGVSLSDILNEALADYRDKHDPVPATNRAGRPTQGEPRHDITGEQE
jgi:hypothetical protein